MTYQQSLTQMEIDKINQMLLEEGLLVNSQGRLEQSANNCFEIASRIASYFGYKTPNSRKELTNRIFEVKFYLAGYSDLPSILRIQSPANLVIREPDDATNVHVTFEIYGYEFNYGARDEHGFRIAFKLPLPPVYNFH